MCRKSLFLVVGVVGLAAALPLHAENDNNNNRALETAVISPLMECSDAAGGFGTFVPLLRAKHTTPMGYVDGGNLYLFTHTTYYPFSNKNCAVAMAQDPNGACNKNLTDSNTANDGTADWVVEYGISWRTPNTVAGMTAPFQKLGYVGPCFRWDEPPGSEKDRGTVAYAGRPGLGRINNKYYFFATRAKGTGWRDGHFDELFMGTTTDPDLPDYLYRYQPILALSTVGGVKYGFLEPIVAPWDSAGTKPFAQLTTPLGAATMWGYVQFGTVGPGPNDRPSQWAPIQIIDTSTPGTRPAWSQVYVYLQGQDGVWRSANRLTGLIDFVPKDASADFGGVDPVSMFLNPVNSRWTLIGESRTDLGAIGCTDDGTHASATTALRQLPPFGGTPLTYVTDNYTQNGWHHSGLIHDIGSTRYLFRASTENACLTRHVQWSDAGNPPNRIHGSEIVVETIPRQ
jgi:hypothetical protein